jgi:hypothetical protein
MVGIELGVAFAAFWDTIIIRTFVAWHHGENPLEALEKMLTLPCGLEPKIWRAVKRAGRRIKSDVGCLHRGVVGIRRWFVERNWRHTEKRGLPLYEKVSVAMVRCALVPDCILDSGHVVEGENGSRELCQALVDEGERHD